MTSSMKGIRRRAAAALRSDTRGDTESSRA